MKDDDFVFEGDCSCHIMPPCGWCVSLTEEESNIMGNDGREALERFWKEKNYER